MDVMFPQLDISHYPPQIFWSAVLFGFFYLFFNYYVIPIIDRVKLSRHNTIENSKKEAALSTKQCDQLRVEIDEILSEAKKHGAAVRTKNHQLAEKTLQKLLKDSENDVQQAIMQDMEKLELFRKRISSDKEQAIAALYDSILLALGKNYSLDLTRLQRKEM